MKKLHVIGIALLAMFTVSVVASASASAEGPWWIILLLSPVEELHRLRWPEEEAVKMENDQMRFLIDNSNSAFTFECGTMRSEEGKLIGNNPGMDLVSPTFWECHLEGKPNCLVENLPESSGMPGGVVAFGRLFSVLAYWDNHGLEERTLVLDAFFADNESSTRITEYKMVGRECGPLLENLIVKMTASGTEVTEVGEAGHTVDVLKRCAFLGEVGILNASGVFERRLSGEEFAVGALSLEEGLGEAFILNANVSLIECLMEVVGVGASNVLGVARLQLESGDEFGWES